MKINRSSLKIKLKRPLSAQDIWNQILDIQIQALELLLEERNLDKWENIFPCYGSSLEEVEKKAEGYIELLQGFTGNTYNSSPDKVENLLTREISTKWVNTIMSTLYMMEDDLMETSYESIFELWDLFFTCQTLRKENNVLAMGLNKLNH